MRIMCKVRCRGVIVHDGKILLVKSANGRNIFSLPGGHLEFGEDPKECIQRELFEELGVLPKVGRLLYVHTYINTEGKQSVEFFFEILNSSEYIGHEEFKRSHAHEIEETGWFAPETDIKIFPELFNQDFKNGLVFSDTVCFLKE